MYPSRWFCREILVDGVRSDKGTHGEQRKGGESGVLYKKTVLQVEKTRPMPTADGHEQEGGAPDFVEAVHSPRSSSRGSWLGALTNLGE